MSHPAQAVLDRNADRWFADAVRALVDRDRARWVPDPIHDAVWGLQAADEPDSRRVLLVVYVDDEDFEESADLPTLIKALA